MASATSIVAYDFRTLKQLEMRRISSGKRSNRFQREEEEKFKFCACWVVEENQSTVFKMDVFVCGVSAYINPSWHRVCLVYVLQIV